MEAIAFGGMLLITIYLIGFTHNYQAALPILGLYAIAGYRLMPALQQIFAYISQLRFTYPMLLNLHDEYFNLNRNIVINKKKSPIKISHYIELVNVSYKFPQSKNFSLNKVNIKIPIKSSIGLVGVTGAGKTTTVDVLLGLLKPQKGALKIDGKFLSMRDSSSWSEIIGYVPQNIFLSDDTIIANIAFGIPEKDINFNGIKKAAQQANLSDFIENDLPDGYFTKIGERGVRLSGGQRQRIGIARALYRDPQVLVFDEATSALDNITEDIVMQAIKQLSKKMSVILIAHRLSTVSACNKIYLLENGSILDEGNYNELLLKSEKFREMAVTQKNKQIKPNVSEGVNHE
jgi:ABC-type multidrug transport system fused ATPase/permease subunit